MVNGIKSKPNKIKVSGIKYKPNKIKVGGIRINHNKIKGRWDKKQNGYGWRDEIQTK